MTIPCFITFYSQFYIFNLCIFVIARMTTSYQLLPCARAITIIILQLAWVVWRSATLYRTATRGKGLASHNTWTCADQMCLVSVSTKSKYSILKYICSLSFGYLKQHCCMGITLLTKEKTHIFYRDDVPTKRKVGM